MKHLFAILFTVSLFYQGFSQSLYVKGVVKDAETGRFLSGVQINVNGLNSYLSDKNGAFNIEINQPSSVRLTFSLMGYSTVVKTVEKSKSDTLLLTIQLQFKSYELPAVTIDKKRKADTVFGTWKFSVADFEFQDDKLLLLTFKKNMKEASIVLADYFQTILIEKKLNFKAIELTKDYLGNNIVIGAQENYYITISEKNISLSEISKNDYDVAVKPLISKQDEKIYFSNYSANYPEFTYYAYCSIDSIAKPIKKIVNEELLHEYNMEFYFLQPKERTYARKISEQYNIDKHIVAATMTGLTSSMFYEPLYDPLFLLNDTICIFNHCNNVLLKYDKSLKQFDSISIDYHHPKNWREWKNQLIVDETNKNMYALYQKNGFYYLKQINIYSGKLMGSFKLSNQYVEGIKIKNDEVYYVYRPFESLQEQFLYKELIIN